MVHEVKPLYPKCSNLEEDQSTSCDHATHEYKLMLCDYINRTVHKQNTIDTWVAGWI